MKVFLVLLGMLIAAEASSMDDAFQEGWKTFKLSHKKKYENESEEKKRQGIYINNMALIENHNAKYATGEKSYKLAMNEFGDMTHDEFLKKMTGYKGSRNSSAGGKTPGGEGPTAWIPIANVDLASCVDWRKEGAVTPVKDQGQCGSCWAFSATGALEGQHFRKTGRLISLSEQNLIDCSGDYGNEGCEGGLMVYAFQYIYDNKGIDSECYYPYEGVDCKCRYKPDNSKVTTVAYVSLPEGDEFALQQAVACVGPISCSFDASHWSFQFYCEGVYDEPSCSCTELNHAVLVAGYGSDDDGCAYWLAKNSWGTSWGKKGYFTTLRDKNNRCGIATDSSYPVV